MSPLLRSSPSPLLISLGTLSLSVWVCCPPCLWCVVQPCPVLAHPSLPLQGTEKPAPLPAGWSSHWPRYGPGHANGSLKENIHMAATEHLPLWALPAHPCAIVECVSQHVEQRPPSLARHQACPRSPFPPQPSDSSGKECSHSLSTAGAGQQILLQALMEADKATAVQPVTTWAASATLLGALP